MRRLVVRILQVLVSWGDFRTACFCESFDTDSDWIFRRASRMRWILFNALRLWAMRECVLHGHRLQSDSCIGPDSATEDFWCDRCGIGLGRVIYY